MFVFLFLSLQERLEISGTSFGLLGVWLDVVDIVEVEYCKDLLLLGLLHRWVTDSTMIIWWKCDWNLELFFLCFGREGVRRGLKIRFRGRWKWHLCPFRLEGSEEPMISCLASILTGSSWFRTSGVGRPHPRERSHRSRNLTGKCGRGHRERREARVHSSVLVCFDCDSMWIIWIKISSVLIYLLNIK